MFSSWVLNTLLFITLFIIIIFPILLSISYNSFTKSFAFFHKIVFVSVYNLALKGVKEATEVEITEFLENYTSEYNTFTDNNGIEYIKTIRTLAKVDNFDYYWQTLKKYSLLRK